MIYIKNETNLRQSISIPKYFESNPTSIRLRLINKLGGEVVEIEPKFFIQPPYITINFKLSNLLVEGEYEYSLIDAEKGVISFGLAVVGDYKRDVQSYVKESKKIQYKG